MISSILQEVLMPVCFGSLLCLMLLYWGQAALFSYTKYSKLTTVLFCFSFISLTTLLIFRWVDSGHFPLSNLYESLLFLSWSFLGIQLVAQLTLTSSMPEPALLHCAESNRPHSAEMSLAKPTRISLSKFFEAKPDFALREVSQWQLLHLLGVITSPMALLTYGFAFLNLPREMQKATALVPALQSNWLMMHVTIMILSYAALLCGSIFSMVFLLLTSLNTSSPRLQALSNPGVGVPNRNTVTPSGFAELAPKGPSALAQTLKLFLGPSALCSASCSCSAKLSKSKSFARPTSSLTEAATLAGRAIQSGPQIEGCLKVEPQGLGPELPKLSFSDRLDLHDWALRAQTRAGRAGGRLLGVAKQTKSKAAFIPAGLALSGPAAGSLVAEQPNGLKGFIKTPYLSLAERLDNYSYRVLALGFPLLTVGILSGAVWANEAWGSYWSWDPKETWALITWLVFAIYLHARILKGWTGRKPAIIATFGFFVVWFCYLGVNLLGTGLHSYGWFSN